jgi:outer membrane immunogenic protein
MKKLLAGLLGLALTGAPALPADASDWYSGSPAPAVYAAVPYPVPAWAGFYAGVNLGYGWSAASDQLACGPACGAITGDGPFGGVSPSGWLGGIQLGYNWQGFGFAPLVLGFETDIQPSSVYAQGSDASGDFFHSRLEMLGTVRGRIGYAMDCALLYFTGGLAYGTVLNEAVLANGSDYLTNPTVTGYVLGGGVEYKFWRDLAVKVEYQYVNLGKNNPVDTTNGTGTYTANGGTIRDDAFNTVRVGLNWWPFGNYVPLPLK